MAIANLKVDTQALADAQAMLANIENGFVRAYARALNTTVTGVRTDMVAMCRDDYTFKVAAVQSRTALEKATFSRLQASVSSTGKETHLTDFVGTNETQKGITVNIRKSTGRQLIPRTFKATVKSGKEIILRRPGDPRGQHATLYGRYGPPGSGGKIGSRARLDVFYGPHPEIIYNTPENWEKLKKQADERLTANFSTEVDGVLRQFG